jgi:O-antigen/teichoic acid export membrane protein
MSRLKYFVHGVLSGYVLLGTNILYTLASVPLALAYLAKVEFGLWAMTSQLTMFLGLIDLGMSGAVARILIDYKDRKQENEYGSLVRTAILVNAAQGLIILCLTLALAFIFSPLLRIPADQEGSFRVLIFGQGAILALTFAARIFGQLLVAHQRNDVANYLMAFTFLGNFAALWIGFAAGAGVMALLWSQAAGTISAAVLAWLCCRRLHLFPLSGKWGHPSWSRFKELFAFGQNMLLFLIGYQLINASQTIIVTRALGLEATAVWTICTRLFFLLTQIITRIFDYASAALAEMMVRGERERLFGRFRSLVTLSLSLSIAAGCVFAVINQPFVSVWTSGKIFWPVWNDVLLGLWLSISCAVHFHSGLAIQSKKFGKMSALFFVQGLLFVVLTLVLLAGTRFAGITTILVVSIVSALAFTLPYGIVRTSHYFDLPESVVALRWFAPAARVLAAGLPISIVVWWLTQPLASLLQLVLRVIGVGLPMGLLFLRVGMDHAVQHDLTTRAPAYLKRALGLLTGQTSAAK